MSVKNIIGAVIDGISLPSPIASGDSIGNVDVVKDALGVSIEAYETANEHVSWGADATIQDALEAIADALDTQIQAI